jgi:hypothetical protein
MGEVMSTEQVGTSHTEEERQLLEEGNSYPQAVSAIIAFRKLVQGRCWHFMRDRLSDYSAALGEKLDKGQLAHYDAPSLSRWEGDWACVGIELRDIGKRKVTLYHTVEWECGRDGTWTTWANASVWVQKPEQVEQLRPLMQKHGPEKAYWEHEQDLGYMLPLSRAEMGTFEKKLDDVLQAWIKFWQRFCGLKALTSS